MLQKSDNADIDRISRLEEKYIAILFMHEVVFPKCIYYKMANDPMYVQNLIEKRNALFEKDIYDSPLNKLFYNYRIAPGTKMNGNLDFERTLSWYNFATKVENEMIHREMLDMFGKALYHTNADKIVSDFEAREYKDGNMLYVSVIDFKDTDSARLDFQSSVILFEQNSPGIATITDNTYVMRSTTEIAYNYLDVIYDVELNGTTVSYIMYVVTDPNSKAASDVVLLYQQLNREIPVCNYSM